MSEQPQLVPAPESFPHFANPEVAKIYPFPLETIIATIATTEGRALDEEVQERCA